MSRYFSSFFITSIIYVVLFSTFLYSFNNTAKINSNPKPSKDRVKVTLIATPLIKEKEVKKEPVKKQIEKKPEKKIVKKEKPKQVIKKKPIPKKIVKKLIEKPVEKKIVKKIIKEPIIEKKETVEKVIQKTLPKKSNTVKKTVIKQHKTIVKKETPAIDTKLIKLKQKQYYTKIKQTIDKNKSYPRMAVKRGIEGDVKVKFTISEKGELISFNILDGKRIFKKSIVNAIKSTFPLTPPKGIFTSNLDLSNTTV